MVLGGVLAGVTAVVVYFVAKFLVSTQRERLALSALLSGGVCVATSGFLISVTLGYFAVGVLLVLVAVLLGYETGQ